MATRMTTTMMMMMLIMIIIVMTMIMTVNSGVETFQNLLIAPQTECNTHTYWAS